MPKYEVLKDSYLNLADARSDNGFAPRYCKVGETVKYDFWPGTSLKPLDAEAKRRVEIVEQYRKSGRRLPNTIAEHDAAERAAEKAATRKPKPTEASKAA